MGAHAGVPPLAEPTGLRDHRVLVVEDDVSVAATLADAVHLAKAMAQAGGLDAAVLGIVLGGELVLPVADALAERRVPFLFATGYGEDCDRDRHGAAPMLHKPFEPRDLVTAPVALPVASSGRPRALGRTPSGGTSPGGEQPSGSCALHPAMADR